MPMQIPQVVKDKPVVSIATVGAVLALLTSVFVIDDRYVKAADFKEYAQEQQKGIDGLYRQIVEDELFALELKATQGKATDIDTARIEHLKRRLDELKSR